jgi:hypothetical protein
MVFQATQSGQSAITSNVKQLSVEQSVDAGAYLVGFEDSNGNFVEVGRLNNALNDVTEPLEIEHQNSGERIKIDNSGFESKIINDEVLYAGAFAGTDADARLDNALAAAEEGQAVILESLLYTKDRTLSQNNAIDSRGLTLKGIPSSSQKGPSIQATWNLSAGEMLLANANINGNGTVEFTTGFSTVRGLRLSGQITVDGPNCVISQISGSGDVVFNSGTSGGVVGPVVGSLVITDNGSNEVL